MPPAPPTPSTPPASPDTPDFRCFDLDLPAPLTAPAAAPAGAPKAGDAVACMPTPAAPAGPACPPAAAAAAGAAVTTASPGRFKPVSSTHSSHFLFQPAQQSYRQGLCVGLKTSAHLLTAHRQCDCTCWQALHQMQDFMCSCCYRSMHRRQCSCSSTLSWMQLHVLTHLDNVRSSTRAHLHAAVPFESLPRRTCLCGAQEPSPQPTAQGHRACTQNR